ncbi:hypothetical protein AB4212_24505, partial [Streptomyces sp. 2MCAF27]
DDATGRVLQPVIAEYVYDSVSGERTATRYVDAETGAPVTVPAGASIGSCEQPDRIARQICLIRTGEAEFATNQRNATAGVDADWQWSNSTGGPWWPMYDVAGITAWTVRDTDTAAPAHWVAPYQDTMTCPPAGATTPGVPHTWFARASWTLPSDVDPASIQISASVLNADNDVVQWRLNDGAWQPVAGGVFNGAAVTFAPTSVPGARAGLNEIIVQMLEVGEPCPGPNAAGIMLHVKATYDYPMLAWTEIIEPDGSVYYLDENGRRQDAIPDAYRKVPCPGGECCPEKPCRDTSTLLLCDLPTDGAPNPTVTDTDSGPYYPYSTGVPTAGAQALWDGGTLTFPDAAGPQPGTTGTVRTAAAIVQAPRPVCDAGTVHVSVQVDAAQLGPDNGCATTGFIGLYNGQANRVALDLAPPNTPAGWTGTLTVEADVPAADLAAGNIVVLLAFDAYDDSGGICPGVRRTSWELSQFDATVVYDQTGCASQFLRNVITDCETGAVVAVTDTTLDGQPYTVNGEPGQCEATGGQCCPATPCPAQNVIEACRCDDTTGDGTGDVDYVELLAVDCTGSLTSLGTYT